MIHFRIPQSKHEWAATLLGLAFVVGCTIPLARGVMSLAWPKTDGVITGSREKPGYRTIGVEIHYRYAAGGRTYTGDRYQFRFFVQADHMESRDVQLIVGRYPPGERVKVAVNPGDPADSVLIPGPNLEDLLPLGVGLLLMTFGMGEVRKGQPAPPEIYLGPPGPRYRTAKILAVIGAGLLLFGARDLYQGWASVRWPQADGRVLYSAHRYNETLLWYEYYVANTRYLAGKYRAGGNRTLFQDVAEAAAKRYPAGRAVRVYYDPSNPSQALLEPGVWYGNFILPVIGAIVLGAAWLAKLYAEAIARIRRR